MQFLKIIDAIPQMKTGTGFFSSFDNPMWADTFPDTSSLDIFFAGTYGQKFISPFTALFLGENGQISNNDLEDIADTIYQIHATEWSHLYADLMAEYDPIENTDAYESTTETRNISGTSANTRTLNTSTATMGSSEANTSGNTSGNTTSNDTSTSNTDNAVYAFDSVTSVPESESDNSSTNANMGTNSQQTQAATTTSNSQTVADTGTIGDTGNSATAETFSRTYHKHGNIGTMTASQLLTGDLELWQWSFIKQICDDILSHIALSVY